MKQHDATSTPDSPDADDLAALAEIASRRRTWRVIPQRHYADVRFLRALAEFAATMVAVMFGAFLGGLLLFTLTGLGILTGSLAGLPGVLALAMFAIVLLIELLTGRTPGKFVTGLLLCQTNGEAPNHGQLAIRFACKYSPVIAFTSSTILDRTFDQSVFAAYAVKIGFLMWIVNGVSLLMCPWTQRRTWYDLLSGTAVFNRLLLDEVRQAGVGFEVQTEPITEAIILSEPRVEPEPPREPEPDPHRPA